MRLPTTTHAKIESFRELHSYHQCTSKQAGLATLADPAQQSPLPRMAAVAATAEVESAVAATAAEVAKCLCTQILCFQQG